MPQEFPKFSDQSRLEPWHLNLFSRALSALFAIRLGPGLGGRFSPSGCTLYLTGHQDHARIAKAPVGGVPGRVTTTCGAANVRLYRMNEDGALVDTGQDVEAFNLSTTSVAADAWIMLERLETGRLVVSWEECVEEEPAP